LKIEFRPIPNVRFVKKSNHMKKTIPRKSTIRRKTKETDIRISLNLDGSGRSKITTGLPFLDHMLELFAKHGLFDLNIDCKGDLEIDDHHSVEDIAITLGQALSEALANKDGINRYGEAIVPMDEALCRTVIDLSGRFYLVYEVPTKRQKIGNFSVELAEHFWRSFAEAAKFNLHIDCLRGTQHASHAGRNLQSYSSCIAEGRRTQFEDCWRTEHKRIFVANVYSGNHRLRCRQSALG
jgi:imidazoleglycerol-phosphate dehydratase